MDLESELRRILGSYTSLRPENIDQLLRENLALFQTALTHSSADPVNNYEPLEFLGDSTLNKCVAWYFARRFPQCCCKKGVKVLTRLKINIVSKRNFASYSRKLGLDKLAITAPTQQIRSGNGLDSLHEDVFEAFFGALEYTLDSTYQIGVGYAVCYELLQNLLDQENITLDYNQLFDAKTRLKELFDIHPRRLGKMEYQCKTLEGEFDDRFCVEVYQYQPREEWPRVIGTGVANLKRDAAQEASAKALQLLEAEGFIRESTDFELWTEPA